MNCDQLCAVMSVENGYHDDSSDDSDRESDTPSNVMKTFFLVVNSTRTRTARTAGGLICEVMRVVARLQGLSST